MERRTTLSFLLGCLIILWAGCEKDANNTNDNCSPPDGAITDARDGEIYSVIKIGNQCWMAENLRYNAPNSSLNPNNPSMIYGRLYSWTTLMNGQRSSDSIPSGVQGICPAGWHLPSEGELGVLKDVIGGTTIGTVIKSTTGWNNSGNGTNVSGFNAFPSGTNYLGNFNGLGNFTQFWTCTGIASIEAYIYELKEENSEFNLYFNGTESGLSCRCVKD